MILKYETKHRDVTALFHRGVHFHFRKSAEGLLCDTSKDVAVDRGARVASLDGVAAELVKRTPGLEIVGPMADSGPAELVKAEDPVVTLERALLAADPQVQAFVVFRWLDAQGLKLEGDAKPEVSEEVASDVDVEDESVAQEPVVAESPVVAVPPVPLPAGYPVEHVEAARAELLKGCVDGKWKGNLGKANAFLRAAKLPILNHNDAIREILGGEYF